MSVFLPLWLVTFLLIPMTPQNPSEVAPATSPTSAPRSPLTSSPESQAKPSPAPASRNSKSGNLIIPVKTSQANPTPKPDGLPAIIAFGNSLTAGYGLTEDQCFTALLQRKIDEKGYRYRVVNAGVSGDTSAGGVSRIDRMCGEGLNHCY